MKKTYNHLNTKKVLITAFAMNFIQLLLIMGIATYMIQTKNEDFFLLIYITLGVTVMNTLVTTVGYMYAFAQQKKDLLAVVGDLESLNSKLREQRHDYLNHLQVVYGLMELEEYQEAKHYMEPVYKDILKVSKALKTSHPAINALLQAKMQVAEEQQIDMFLEIKSNLKEIALEPWELCKVLANIVDNGLCALGESNQSERHMYMDISEDKENYLFHIYNNGPPMAPHFLKEIFKEGVTTKKGEGHGMGLAIVSQIIASVDGTITVQSQKDRTSFHITIPKMTV